MAYGLEVRQLKIVRQNDRCSDLLIKKSDQNSQIKQLVNTVNNKAKATVIGFDSSFLTCYLITPEFQNSGTRLQLPFAA